MCTYRLSRAQCRHCARVLRSTRHLWIYCKPYRLGLGGGGGGGGGSDCGGGSGDGHGECLEWERERCVSLTMCWNCQRQY
jgi:hypothetical protein